MACVTRLKAAVRETTRAWAKKKNRSAACSTALEFGLVRGMSYRRDVQQQEIYLLDIENLVSTFSFVALLFIPFQLNKRTVNLTPSPISLLHSFGRPSVAQSESYWTKNRDHSFNSATCCRPTLLWSLWSLYTTKYSSCQLISVCFFFCIIVNYVILSCFFSVNSVK